MVGLGNEERPRDLRCRQPDERAQRERDLGLECQRRVAAGEDQPQPVVTDAALVAVARVDRAREHRHLLELGGPGRGAAQPVDGAVARGRREPRAGIARDAVARPAFEREGEGVLRALLGEVPVARHPDEGGDDLAPLVAECCRDGGLDVGDYISQIGLTSIDAVPGAGDLRRDLDRLVEVLAVDEVEAAHLLLGLGEGAVGRQDLAVAHAHGGGVVVGRSRSPPCSTPRLPISSLNAMYSVEGRRCFLGTPRLHRRSRRCRSTVRIA